jgi:tryptophan 2,3-dioxygenase
MTSTRTPASADHSAEHSAEHSADLTYGSYLRLPDLLACQQPRTAEHDELLFVIIHQVYELWFKQILHEAALLQERLETGNSSGALQTARRITKILKTIVGQLDVLETMTPRQFASFRPQLGSSSGFQSDQFRELEAVLGRRDLARTDPPLDAAIAGALLRRSVFDSLLRFLVHCGYDIPEPALERDPAQPWPEGDPSILDALRAAYADDTGLAAEVCESLVDIDEGIQEWRYRHVKMVERTIGAQLGTGGSAGAAYLRATLFRPAFADLWTVRGAPQDATAAVTGGPDA